MSCIEIPSDLNDCLRKIGLNITDVVLYLGSKCNLRCTHCYIGNELLAKSSFYSYESILRFLSGIDVLERITVLGGEPLLYPEFNKLVTYLSKYTQTEKRVTTNATVTKNIDWDNIKKAGIRICISLDGHTQKLHDMVRGKNNFSKTIDTILKLTKNGHDIEITHTVNANNIDHIDGFIDLCRRLRVKRINLHRATPRGNAKQNSYLVVEATRWRLLIDHLRGLDKKDADSIQLRYELAFATEDEYRELITKGIYTQHSSSSYYSKIGGNRVVIYPDGKLYISSEAFGTESYIGSFDKDGVSLNSKQQSELKISKTDSSYITKMNKDMVGDGNYPIVLCVSYREKITI